MDTAKLEVVNLPGPPFARGRLHGEQLGPQIHELLTRWRRHLADACGVEPATYLRRFQEETAYEATIQALAPQILEELRGISDGSGAAYEELLAFQHINEEFELAPRFAMDGGEACSTIAAPPTGSRPALIAQNLDLAEYLDGFQVLLRYPCDESDGEILALSVPGMISLNGVNSFGFAVCDNALTDLMSSATALPVFVLYRLLLECQSLSEAIKLVSDTPPAAGLNWVMGDPDGVVMIERSANRMDIYGPAEPRALAFHTNHPLVCADWRPELAPGAKGRPAPSRSSHLRLAALQTRLLGDNAGFDVAAAKSILSSTDDADYPVSRSGGLNGRDHQIGFTLASSVFELRRGAPRWHLASGPPHRTAYMTFEF